MSPVLKRAAYCLCEVRVGDVKQGAVYNSRVAGDWGGRLSKRFHYTQVSKHCTVLLEIQQCSVKKKLPSLIKRT